MEEKFIWTEEYSVRNNIIDEQHKTFLSIANDLIALSEGGLPDSATLFENTTKLGNYAMYHLSTEEEMFEKYGYPEAEEHAISHNVFRDEAEKMINDVRNGEGNVSKEARRVAEFCNNWLVNHIMIMDKRYSQFFIDKGLK